jgi:hypothetical protein
LHPGSDQQLAGAAVSDKQIILELLIRHAYGIHCDPENFANRLLRILETQNRPDLRRTQSQPQLLRTREDCRARPFLWEAKLGNRKDNKLKKRRSGAATQLFERASLDASNTMAEEAAMISRR